MSEREVRNGTPGVGVECKAIMNTARSLTQNSKEEGTHTHTYTLVDTTRNSRKRRLF